MEWLVVNPQLHTLFASLGSQVGECYIINPECHLTLDEILRKLSLEDRTLRTFRRAIGFSEVIKKDLLPLLVNAKDNQSVTDAVIKVLVNLTLPVECLLPIEVMSKTDVGRNTIYELSCLLTSCKEAFLDSRATKRVIEHIRDILSKGDKLSPEDTETVNNCLILLRNILHIPEQRMNNGSSTQQNQLLWNLFGQNIDKILLTMITERNQPEWTLSIVQLIALMYKDQNVAILQKLLNLWFEASELSESSEDNESNTSPPERGSGDSSSMVTSDPTSDSSDNSGCDRNSTSECKGQKMSHVSVKKIPQAGRKQTSKQVMKKQDALEKQSQRSVRPGEGEHSKMECSSELSDCGYGTQVENQESISTSSNDDELPNRCGKPVHQKPGNMVQKSRYPSGKPLITLQEKEDLRRKKLIRRSRTNTVNMKALLHHSPTEEDISHLLKEFTVDFLLKGYSTLVVQLCNHLLHNNTGDGSMDTSHFFWLVTYFLKFSAQLELDLEHVRPVLSFDVLSYLVYEAVNLCEQFELTHAHLGGDIGPCLRRMHLVVTAVREFLQAVNTYKKVNYMTQEDMNHINILQRKICDTEELRCLFVLLLRQFAPTVHSRQYLQDLVITNHLLLSFIESNSLPNQLVCLQTHMRQFVAADMMKQFGFLLESYQENGQFINDCIFTMMHHVAGDLEHVTALFQPSILKTFSVIWETDFQICDDWSDLIEYVMHKFINMPQSIPMVQEKKEGSEIQASINKPEGWSQEECDSLYWYYIQSAQTNDPVGAIINLYAQSGIFNKTRIGVIEQLLKQDVISGGQYNELLENEPIIDGALKETPKKLTESHVIDEIELLKEHLMKEDKMVFVMWIQKLLLEACYAKLRNKIRLCHVVEPVTYYCSLLQEPIPVVAWNCDQCSIMQHQPFVLLLHKMGFHLPADTGRLFARIPHFWGPDALYNLACKLGPIQQDWVKFDPAEVSLHPGEVVKDSHSFTTGIEHSPPYISTTPKPNLIQAYPNLPSVPVPSLSQNSKFVSSVLW